MESQEFTREELYHLVWTSPLLSLSKKYQISEVGLRKICVRMSIPLPTNGYWMKLKFGTQGDKAPLSPHYHGENVIVLKARDETCPYIEGGDSELYTLRNEIEMNLKHKLMVPGKVTNP